VSRDAAEERLPVEILAIGSDVVECLRVARMIERHGEAFLNRVYTPREIRHCRGRRHATEHFAGHWAAKQAIVQCLGKRQGLVFTDMEVRSDKAGVPKLYLAGAARERAQRLRIADILLTICHCRAYATATAIALGLPRDASPKK
jgi:holo-[acyl-carrier protein] synthase